MFHHARPPFLSGLFQPQRREQRPVDLPVYHEAVVTLVMGYRPACALANVSIDRTIIVSLLAQTRLDIASDRGAGHVIAGIDDQPAAVVPPVIVISPPMIHLLVPVGMAVAGGPAAVVMIRLIALDRECRALRLPVLALTCLLKTRLRQNAVLRPGVP